MARQEDVYLALELFQEHKPQKTLDDMNDMGMFAVLKFLNDAHEPISSADICKKLGVSSARIAVIMKKLEYKGLICKSASNSDARVKMVALSEKGKMLANKMKQHMYNCAEQVVDELGIERLIRIFEDIGIIKEIFDNNPPKDMEKLYD